MVLKCREVWEVTTNCDTGLKDVTYFGSDPNKENHICGIWVPSSTLDDGSAWTCDVSVLGKVTTILLRLHFNTSHNVLGDISNFYQKLLCITRHAIPFYQIPGLNTEHREILRPGWKCWQGTFFIPRPGWNNRIWGKIHCVLNISPVTCIQDERTTESWR